MPGLARNRAAKHANSIYHYLQSVSPQTFRSLVRNLRGLRGQFYREAIGNVRAMPKVATDGEIEDLPLDHVALSSVSIGPREPPFVPAVHFEVRQITFPNRFCPMSPFDAPRRMCHEHSAVHWGTFEPPPSERNAGHSSEDPLPERDKCLLGFGQVLSRAFLNAKERLLNKRLTL